MTGEKLKNFIKQELNEANKNDPSHKRASEKKFVKYLLKASNDSINEFIESELKSIFDENLL